MIKESPFGRVGEVKEVKDGFARNYLFPRGLALPATASNLKTWEERKKFEERRQIRLEEKIKELAQRIEGMTLSFKVKVGSGGKVYGSITSRDIAEELRRQGIEIDKRQIELPQPLREIGSFEVVIRLGKELNPKLKVIVEGKDGDKATTK